MASYGRPAHAIERIPGNPTSAPASIPGTRPPHALAVTAVDGTIDGDDTAETTLSAPSDVENELRTRWNAAGRQGLLYPSDSSSAQDSLGPEDSASRNHSPDGGVSVTGVEGYSGREARRRRATATQTLPLATAPQSIPPGFQDQVMSPPTPRQTPAPLPPPAHYVRGSGQTAVQFWETRETESRREEMGNVGPSTSDESDAEAQLSRPRRQGSRFYRRNGSRQE